jgi:hypothetical protein
MIFAIGRCSRECLCDLPRDLFGCWACCYIDPKELSLFLLREDVMFQVRSQRRRLNMQPAYLPWSLPGGDSDQGRQRNRVRLRQGTEE